MAHMKPEVTEFQETVWIIETDQGVTVVPMHVGPFFDEGLQRGWAYEKGEHLFENYLKEHLKGYADGDIQAVEIKSGFCGRYSAPGYLDATDWSFNPNKEQLLADLEEMYGDHD